MHAPYDGCNRLAICLRPRSGDSFSAMPVEYRRSTSSTAATANLFVYRRLFISRTKKRDLAANGRPHACATLYPGPGIRIVPSTAITIDAARAIGSERMGFHLYITEGFTARDAAKAAPQHQTPCAAPTLVAPRTFSRDVPSVLAMAWKLEKNSSDLLDGPRLLRARGSSRRQVCSPALRAKY